MNFRRTIRPCRFYCLLGVSLFIETAQSSGCHENSSILVDDVCFFYNKDVIDWFGAKKLCTGLGMQMATVDSTKKIRRLISNLKISSFVAMWVGANDLTEEGKFVWDEDQTPVSKDVWQPGEPNQAIEEDCAIVESNGLLYDMFCLKLYRSLCMYQLSPSTKLVGVDNNLICHCASGSCHSNGTCSSKDVRCARGWFGPRCQFRSLSGDKQGLLSELADNDDNTCSSQFSLPLNIKLNKGSTFTWLRITVKMPDDFGDLNIYFIINNLKVACQGMKALPVNERAVDIICHEGPFLVDDVILSWSGKKTVCSVDINGEQNFAFLQNTILREKQESVNGSMLPVDGGRGTRDRCFIGQPGVGHQKWTMTFSIPKVVNEISIYRRPRPEGYAFMDMFYVKGYDARDAMLFQYNDTGGNTDKPTVWIFSRANVPMKRIVIGLEQANETLYLELCEVEAFGACVPPKYGLFCDKTCDVRCSGQMCHHNGMCIVCAFGDSKNGGCLSEVPTTNSANRGNVTKSAAWPCTKPLVDTSEDTQLVKLLIISCVLFAVLVIVLIAYIIKRMQDEHELVKEPVDEDLPSLVQSSSKSKADIAFLGL